MDVILNNIIQNSSNRKILEGERDCWNIDQTEMIIWEQTSQSKQTESIYWITWWTMSSQCQKTPPWKHHHPKHQSSESSIVFISYFCFIFLLRIRLMISSDFQETRTRDMFFRFKCDIRSHFLQNKLLYLSWELLRPGKIQIRFYYLNWWSDNFMQLLHYIETDSFNWIDTV